MLGFKSTVHLLSHCLKYLHCIISSATSFKVSQSVFQLWYIILVADIQICIYYLMDECRLLCAKSWLLFPEKVLYLKMILLALVVN